MCKKTRLSEEQLNTLIDNVIAQAIANETPDIEINVGIAIAEDIYGKRTTKQACSLLDFILRYLKPRQKHQWVDTCDLLHAAALMWEVAAKVKYMQESEQGAESE
jgi:hypothetical protein